ncbi:MAG: phospholipase D-like domain-containing protein [Betaproteobacteria bacterium]|nr:phospholipase D-like domain-containing protein [Betaproteobacteria bacterium]
MAENLCACAPARRDDMTCKINPIWFINETEYPPVPATFELLICGEEAFGAVHRAIAAAKHSVNIICWGFQPSMYFVRNPTARANLGVPLENRPTPSIGQLLERKAKEGVKVRVLCFAFELALAPYEINKANVTGQALGESNTVGRGQARIGDKPSTITEEQYAYDVWWYSRYDRDAELGVNLVNSVKRLFGDDPAHKNLEFRSRGFSSSDRAKLAAHTYRDKKIGPTMRGILAAAPSHHQKMVLVDVESPADHVGFVMGHNMLDAYWDTRYHPYIQRQGHQARNGKVPFEDFSSRITGPLVGNLFYNFSTAWKKEGGSIPDFPKDYFNDFPLYTSKLDPSDPSDASKDGNIGAIYDKQIVGHIVRTQPQYGKYDIMKTYLHVVKNASQYIYIENQYFRWPPLADAIIESAQKQANWNRDPGIHGPLYLFVITNSSDDGMGAGTQKTYEMLDALGRSDTIPGVTKHNEVEDLNTQIKQAEKDNARAKSAIEKQRKMDQTPGNTYSDKDKWAKLTADANAKEARLKELKAQREKLDAMKPEDFKAEERPGLKIHVCTLVPPDLPDNLPRDKQWSDYEVYIHAKLMMINDTYMTLGSANINTRSMEVDTEMNVCHFRPEITQKARKDLWALHTKGRTGADDDMEDAFYQWDKIIKENLRREKDKQKPTASLRGFMRTDPTIKNND